MHDEEERDLWDRFAAAALAGAAAHGRNENGAAKYAAEAADKLLEQRRSRDSALSVPAPTQEAAPAERGAAQSPTRNSGPFAGEKIQRGKWQK